MSRSGSRECKPRIILFHIIYCVVLNSTSFPWSFIFAQEGVVKERPWFRLVMCLGDKTIFMGGVPIFQKIVAASTCHLKNESRAITMFFGNLHSSISGSSYWNVNLSQTKLNAWKQFTLVEMWLLLKIHYFSTMAHTAL